MSERLATCQSRVPTSSSIRFILNFVGSEKSRFLIRHTCFSSDHLFKVFTIGVNTRIEPLAPLVDRAVNDGLVKAGPFLNQESF
jgi:hypothetical protein